NYELPFGNGKLISPSSKVVRALADNWQVNAIIGLHSGMPYDVIYQGDLANVGNTFVRANLVADPTPQHTTPAAWFNTSAFAVPPPFTFGDSGRNSLRSDGYANIDFSLLRQFPLGDRVRLEFRPEAFNLNKSGVFAVPGNAINALGFGGVTSTANAPRQLQVALKLQF